MRKTYFFILLLALTIPASTYAGSASARNIDIFPATKIDVPEIDSKIVSLLNVFNLLRGGSDGKLDSKSISEINFYFTSGEGYINSERVSREALTAFQNDTAIEISELSTNTDTCYVQNFRFDADQKITVVIHNEDHDYQDDVYRCLVAGLWWFTYENLDDFDSINWQKSFLELF